MYGYPGRLILTFNPSFTLPISETGIYALPTIELTSEGTTVAIISPALTD